MESNTASVLLFFIIKWVKLLNEIYYLRQGSATISKSPAKKTNSAKYSGPY